MAYELRVAGRSPERFETSEEAEARARALLRQDADLQMDLIDLASGKPYAPGGDAGDREAMAKKVGF